MWLTFACCRFSDGLDLGPYVTATATTNGEVNTIPGSIKPQKERNPSHPLWAAWTKCLSRGRTRGGSRDGDVGPPFVTRQQAGGQEEHIAKEWFDLEDRCRSSFQAGMISAVESGGEPGNFAAVVAEEYRLCTEGCL